MAVIIDLGKVKQIEKVEYRNLRQAAFPEGVQKYSFSLTAVKKKMRIDIFHTVFTIGY